MKIQITETIEKEVDLTFPCYRKYGAYTYFKMISEAKTLTVSFPVNGETEIQITNWFRNIAFDSDKSVEITPEEFSKVFIMAKNAINEL